MNENIFNNLENINGSLSEVVSQLDNMNDTCLLIAENLNAINEIGFDDVISNISNVVSIAAGIADISANWAGFLNTIKGLPALFSSLAGPIGGVTLLVGGLILGLSQLSGAEDESTKKAREFIEAQEAKRKELIETSNVINESTKKAVQKSKEVEAESQALRSFVYNLRDLADENGHVKNFEEAQYYVDKINSAMPETVKLTKDGYLAWKENSKSIDENIKKIEENIKQLERKAKVEAYYDGYVESLGKEAKLRGDLTLAQNNYNAALKEQEDAQAKLNELQAKYDKQGYLDEPDIALMNQYGEELVNASVNLKEYSDNLDKAKGAYDANAKRIELYRYSLDALDGSVSSSVKLQLEEYKELDENGKVTWESLAAASEDCKNRMVTAQKDELEAIQATSALVQVEMINKALSQGMTYDQMISELQEKGMQLNDTEKKQLMKSFDQWKMNSEDIKNAQAKGLDTLKLMKATTLSDMNENDQRILSESVKAFAKNGDASGIELCNKLAASLEANNGKVTDEAKGIMNEIKDVAYNTDPTVSIRALPPSKSSIEQIRSIINNISKDKKVTIDVALNASAKVMQIIGASAKTFASGGFPDTGELFVAREAGPELVGRINGKTAVANNDQIVSGISSGVFNAVTSAMKGINSKGNMNIHATFVMDGEVVGKQVIKYHNGVVNRTGRSPLMI